MTMKPSRMRVGASITSAVGAILAGILGGWLAGRWAWGIAAGVLALIAMVVGAEAIKARGEESNAKPSDDSYARTVDRRISIAGGYQAVGNDSIVASGDVNQSHITNIRRGSPFFAAFIVCALVLASATYGTIYFGYQRGGKLHSTQSIVRADRPHQSSPARSSSEQPAGSGTVDSYAKAATFMETDSTGDSVTQSIYLASPAHLSAFPQVISAIQNEDNNGGTCAGEAGADPEGRDIAIPFSFVSELNSLVSVQASLSMQVSDFRDSGGLGGVVYGNFADGISCDVTGSYVTLNKSGGPSVFNGWIILSDAITGNQSNGNMAAIGQTGLTFNIELNNDQSSSTTYRATGPGVCVEPMATSGLISTLNIRFMYLHIGGTAYSWERCTGSYKGYGS